MKPRRPNCKRKFDWRWHYRMPGEATVLCGKPKTIRIKDDWKKVTCDECFVEYCRRVVEESKK